jgi:hypothetical protein
VHHDRQAVRLARTAWWLQMFIPSMFGKGVIPTLLLFIYRGWVEATSWNNPKIGRQANHPLIAGEMSKLHVGHPALNHT